MQVILLGILMGAIFGARNWHRTMVYLYGRFHPSRAVLLGLAIKSVQWALFGAAIGGLATLLEHDRDFFQLAM